MRLKSCQLVPFSPSTSDCRAVILVHDCCCDVQSLSSYAAATGRPSSALFVTELLSLEERL